MVFLPPGARNSKNVSEIALSHTYQTRAKNTEEKRDLINCLVSNPFKNTTTEAISFSTIERKRKEYEKLGLGNKCRDLDTVDLYETALHTKFLLLIKPDMADVEDEEIMVLVSILSRTVPILIGIGIDDPIRKRGLPILFSDSVSGLDVTSLDSQYRDYLGANGAVGSKYSVASLFTPFWLPKVVPIEQIMVIMTDFS